MDDQLRACVARRVLLLRAREVSATAMLCALRNEFADASMLDLVELQQTAQAPDDADDADREHPLYDPELLEVARAAPGAQIPARYDFDARVYRLDRTRPVLRRDFLLSPLDPSLPGVYA
jgi:hypothetical protein